MHRIYQLLSPPLKKRSRGFGLFIVGVSVGLAFALRLGLKPWIGSQAPFITLFPAILVCAWLGGARMGMLATAVSALLSISFIVPPGTTGGFENQGVVVIHALFVIEGLMISLICGLVHHSMLSWRQARDDRQCTESALERQRALLKTIIDAVPAMVAYIDTDERFVLHNRRYEEWLGLGPGDIQGKTVRELLGEIRYPEARPHLQAALAGNNVRYEKTIHAPHKNRDAMVTYRPDIRPDGRVAGVVIHAFDITESRQLAIDVARSEKRYRTLITASAPIVWTADPEGRITEANGWEAFTGRSLQGDICANWADAIHPEDRAWVQDRWHAACRARETWDCAYRLLSADGRHHHVHSRGAPIVNSRGEIEEWIGTVTDIHQRVEAGESLRRKEAELKLIVDTVPALVAYVDNERRYVLANHAHRKWFGLDPESMRGMTVEAALGETGYLRFEHHITRALAGEEISFEETLTIPGEEPRWLHVTYTPHRGDDGTVLGFFGLAIDVSEQKKIERKLADLLERYRFLADAMPQNVWTANAAGEQDYVNRRWIEYTGLDLEAGSNNRWREIIHPDDVEATVRAWCDAVAGGGRYEAEHRLRDRSGNYHWFLSLALARRDDTGRIVQWVGTATNIDAQRRAYAELAEARGALRLHADNLEREVRQRTARLEEVNAELEAFTYSASHDLRVPLRHIHGFCEAILADSGDTLSKENQAHLNLILSSARRMDALIRDLLAYSRLSRDEITLAPLSLDTVVADVIADHRATMDEQRAEICVRGPLPSVMADSVGLHQVLSNLVGNALKFVPPGVPPRVVIRAEPCERRVRLWIEDNGIGIAPAYHREIFALFRRLHGAKTYAGTGIGLSLVHKGMVRMGGECGVESALGEGSRFWLEFQAAPIG